MRKMEESIPESNPQPSEGSMRKKTIKIMAVVIAVIVILATILMIVSLQNQSRPLYATITVSGFLSYSVSNPTYKISVDKNGDDIFEIADTITPSVSALGSLWYCQIGYSHVYAVIDGRSSDWNFKIEILNGSTPIHFDDSLDASTHVCNMSTTGSGAPIFNYGGHTLFNVILTDPFIAPIPNTCDVIISYELSSTSMPNQQYQ